MKTDRIVQLVYGGNPRTKLKNRKVEDYKAVVERDVSYELTYDSNIADLRDNLDAIMEGLTKLGVDLKTAYVEYRRDPDYYGYNNVTYLTFHRPATENEVEDFKKSLEAEEKAKEARELAQFLNLKKKYG